MIHDRPSEWGSPALPLRFPGTQIENPRGGFRRLPVAVHPETHAGLRSALVTCRRWTLVVLCIAAAGAAAGTASQSAAPRHGGTEGTRPQNCGLSSLRALHAISGGTALSADWTRVGRAFSRTVLTLTDLREAGLLVGLSLEGWRLTTEELVGLHTPAIVHFQNAHYSVLVDGDQDWVRWLDGGVEMRVSSATEFSELFSGYCLLPDTATTSAGHPSLWFSNVHGQAGAVRGSTVCQTFGCENRGAKTIHIRAEPCSSGLRVAVVPGPTLRAGGKAAVRLEGEVRGASGIHVAKVMTDDPATPVRYLTIAYQRSVAVSALPRKLSGTCQRGASRQWTIWVRGSHDLHLPHVASGNPALSVSVRTPSQDEAPPEVRYAIDVATLPVPPGLHRGDLLVKTSDPATPLLRIPSDTAVRGFVRAVPRQAFFGFVRPGELARLRIVVAAPGIADFTVTGVRAEGTGIRVAEPEHRPDGSFVCVVELLPNLTPGTPVDGAITVATNVDGEEAVVVPVAGYVAD